MYITNDLPFNGSPPLDIHEDSSAVNLLAVPFLVGGLQVFLIFEFDEGVASGLTAGIVYKTHVSNGTELLAQYYKGYICRRGGKVKLIFTNVMFL